MFDPSIWMAEVEWRLLGRSGEDDNQQKIG